MAISQAAENAVDVRWSLTSQGDLHVAGHLTEGRAEEFSTALAAWHHDGRRGVIDLTDVAQLEPVAVEALRMWARSGLDRPRVRADADVARTIRVVIADSLDGWSPPSLDGVDLEAAPLVSFDLVEAMTEPSSRSRREEGPR